MMHEIAIVSRAVLDFDDYGPSKSVAASITNWDRVTDEELDLLERWLPSAGVYGRDYVLLRRIDFQSERGAIFSKIEAAVARARKEIAARERAEAERTAKSAARRTAAKLKMLAKLKAELGDGDQS